MNIFTRVKEFFMNLFKTSAEKEFKVDIISSDCELCKKVTLKPFRGTKMSSPHRGFFRF